ncbi:recombinase family protein, partial [Salmonella enterica]|nr:recombinase family protein [Salmonella enterica]
CPSNPDGPTPPGAQAGRLIGAGVPRQQVAIIYDVGLSTLYRKFPVSKLA